MVPYWVLHTGSARIERHVPVVPFSQDAAALPRLRKSLAHIALRSANPDKRSWLNFSGPTAQPMTYCACPQSSASNSHLQDRTTSQIRLRLARPDDRTSIYEISIAREPW